MRFALCFALSLSLLSGVSGSGFGILPVSAQAQHLRPLRVVIAPFRNLSRQAEDEWLSDSFAESLTMGLLKVDALQLVERNQVQQLLKEQQFGQSGLVNEQSAPQLGQLVGAKVVVLGAYQKVGDHFQAWVRFVDVESGQIDPKRSTQVEGRFQDIFALQKQLASNLMAQLQIQPQASELNEMQQVLQATASLEAYQHYMQGIKLMRGGDSSQYKLARRAFEAANQADPQYVLPIAALAEVHALLARERQQLVVLPQMGMQNEDNAAQAENYVAQAQALNHRLPQVKRAQSRLAQLQGKREEALLLAKEAIQLEPKDSDSVLVYVELKMTGENLVPLKALQQELQAMGVNAQDPWLQFAIGSYGMVTEYFKAKPQLQWIHDLFAEAEAQLPDYPYIKVMKMSLALRENNQAEYVRLLPQVQARSTQSPALLSLLSSMELGRQEAASALHFADLALALDPEGFNALSARAEALAAMGRTAESEQIYAVLNQRMPDSTLLSFTRGMGYFAQQRFDQASAYFRETLTRWKKHPDGIVQNMIFYLLGLSEMAQQKWPEAQQAIERLRQDPAYYQEAYKLLAGIYTQQEDYTAAFEAYQAYLQIDPEAIKTPETQAQYRWYYLLNQHVQEPENAAILNDLAQMAWNRQEPDKAEKMWQKAIELAPDHAVIAFNYGTFALERQDWSRAQSLLERAVALKTDYIKAWYNLGLARQSQGFTQLARQAWEQVLVLEPLHTEAKNALARLSSP